MDSDTLGETPAAAENSAVVDVVVTQHRTVNGGLHSRVYQDRLIVEEPLSIRLDDTLVTTTMRTPGHDLELAVGFCFTEGLLNGELVVDVAHCVRSRCASAFGSSPAPSPGGPSRPLGHAGPAAGDADVTQANTVTVRTGGRAPVPTPRLGTTSSSCGWCGSEQLEALAARLESLPAVTAMDAEVLMKVAGMARSRQDLFGDTGASHCAAAFDSDANVLVLREDVGRHNAVDKVVGRLHLDDCTMVPPDWGLFVSGRASIEMVQKAWAAGFGTLVAVSAPTALAVDAARQAGMTLAAFVRPNGFNVYSPAP